MINQHITIFIPTYNNETTILDTLQSIERQKTNQIRKIIIIDDGSTDQTIDLINNHIKTSHIEFNFIKNTKPTGLSRKYNKAIDLVKTELLIIMHADIVIERNNAIEKYYKIMENESNVAAISKIRHRFEDWKKFTFWEKCEFDRFLMSQRHEESIEFTFFPKSKFFPVFESMSNLTYGRNIAFVFHNFIIFFYSIISLYYNISVHYYQ